MTELQRQIQAERIRKQVVDLADLAGLAADNPRRIALDDVLTQLDHGVVESPTRFAQISRTVGVQASTVLQQVLDDHAQDPEFADSTQAKNLGQSIDLLRSTNTTQLRHRAAAPAQVRPHLRHRKPDRRTEQELRWRRDAWTASRPSTDLLSALAGRQRGEPIQAEQWNTLVDVLRGVLEIDRAQETGLAASLADAYAPIDHQHLGQVSLAWLDTDLQDRMVTGGAGSVSVRDKLTDLAARIGDLSGTVSTLSTQLEGVQKRADDSSIDELARSSKLRAFETRFNGVEDLRGLVTSVSAQVQDLSPHVDQVLELRSELTDAAGAPIDVRSLAARLDGLGEALSAATGGVDGARAADA